MTPIPPGFQAAVFADQGDDLPRLVYADWLEETAGDVVCSACNGERWKDSSVRGIREQCPCDDGFVSDGRRERAEFIRVQCELAKLAEPPIGFKGCVHCDRNGDYGNGLCRYHFLRDREKVLFHRYKCEWFGDSWAILCLEGDPVDHLELAVTFVRRGFPAALTCTAGAWLGEACRRCQDFNAERRADPTIGNPGHRCSECHQPLGSGRTPGLHESLEWHDGKTMACGRCDGDGEAHGADRPFEWSSDVDYGKCVVCRGKGTVPRPMPATAVPLEEVTFSAVGGAEWGRFRERLSNARGDDWSHPDYPGLTFRLPGGSNAGTLIGRIDG